MNFWKVNNFFVFVFLIRVCLGYGMINIDFSYYLVLKSKDYVVFVII